MANHYFSLGDWCCSAGIGHYSYLLPPPVTIQTWLQQQSEGQQQKQAEKAQTVGVDLIAVLCSSLDATLQILNPFL